MLREGERRGPPKGRPAKSAGQAGQSAGGSISGYLRFVGESTSLPGGGTLTPFRGPAAGCFVTPLRYASGAVYRQPRRKNAGQAGQAIFAAYGWPSDLSDEEILERLLALNLERAEKL
jgi:hypothetical protein